MVTERRNDDQTSIDLVSVINAIFNPPIKTSEEVAEEARKAEEERESKRRLYRERNELLRREVQELGLKEIFSKAREALAQHYPSATVHEQWDKDQEMSDDKLYFQYRIVLAWKPSKYDQKLISRAGISVDEYHYTDAVYTRIDQSRKEFEIGLRRDYTRYGFSELQNVNSEKLKGELLEGIKHPKWHREYHHYSPEHGPLHDSRFHGGG